MMEKSLRTYHRMKTNMIYSKMDQYYDFVRMPKKGGYDDES
jgi:hypothetical protein